MEKECIIVNGWFVKYINGRLYIKPKFIDCEWIISPAYHSFRKTRLFLESLGSWPALASELKK